MKYSESEAKEVIRMFERYLNQDLIANNYNTCEFFHVFHIKPIKIGNKIMNQVKFKDSLVDDCINSQGNLPLLDDLVKKCFS